jgi:CRP/FNR family transcriptional regulator, cyclic AMP receptor protein
LTAVALQPMATAKLAIACKPHTTQPMKTALFLLGELDDDDIDWMIGIGSRQEIPTHTKLIAEGQPISNLYLLLEGALSVFTNATQGQEIAILSSGDVVGEMSFIDTRPPSATVIAKCNSIVLTISREQLDLKLRLDVAFAARFYRALAISLSSRLRLRVAQFQAQGGALSAQQVQELPVNELDKSAQENATLAMTRLDWLLRRLKDENS